MILIVTAEFQDKTTSCSDRLPAAHFFEYPGRFEKNFAVGPSIAHTSYSTSTTGHFFQAGATAATSEDY